MRHCSAVTALGLKYRSAAASRRVRGGVPARTGVRLQCPLVERGLKGRYQRVWGEQYLDSFLRTISTKGSSLKEPLF